MTADDTTEKPRLFAVKLTRELLILATDENAAMEHAEELLNLDANDYEMEDSRDAIDVTERLARIGVENGKRVLRIVPEGDNPKRLTVARLIAENANDMEPVSP
jgi:hypothetical protein